MGNDQTTKSGRVTCSADFGNGHELEMDFQGAQVLWIAAGSGVSNADVWMKGTGGVPDLRIRIERTSSGIQVAVDRGQQSEKWWSLSAAPRMNVIVRPNAHVAAVTASVGETANFQEVFLGQTDLK
jgi:hypothetical protein